MGDALRDLRARSGASIPRLQLRPSVYSSARSPGAPIGQPEIVKTWRYDRADGSIAFEVRRIQFRLSDGTWEIDPGKGKLRKSYRPFDPVARTLGMPPGFDRPGSRPLFGLSAIFSADPAIEIIITEGEPAADAVASMGSMATTSSGGAASPDRTDWSPLAGRDVLVWPDNDEAGQRYARSVTALLGALSPAPRVRWVDVAQLGLPVGGDAVDWVARQKRSAP